MSNQAYAATSDKDIGSSSSRTLSRKKKRQSPDSVKRGRGFLEEGLNRQPLKFDSQFHADLDHSGTSERNFKDDKSQRWEEYQDDWNSNWESNSADSDSRGADLSGKGKGRATPFSTTIKAYDGAKNQKQGMSPRRSHESPLRYTKQKSPFHTSQIGKLAAQRPHSIGLFKPDYPFTPSGRKRKSPPSTSEEPNSLPTTFKYEYSLDPSMMNSNILKHGWTASILDDDVKLSVPDESRRSRLTSLYTRELLGKKWFRWRPGEGWVYCRTKDLSTYRHGPGIALGQLLPPRDKAVTSQLPMIPNDSKRDFAWTLITCMIFFTLVAMIHNFRKRWRSKRKGKRRNRSSEYGGQPNLVRSRAASLLNGSANRSKARQRTQAQQFRDLCHFALRKSVDGVGQAASNTTTVMANIRWTSSANGISSGLIAGSATRRQFHNDNDVDGATIELLEKGGVDGGSSIVSPVKEIGDFDLHQVATCRPGCSDEKSR